MKTQTVTIESIASVKGGKRLPKGHELLTTLTKHPYIRARDIGDGKVEIQEPVYISDSTYQKINRYTVKSNDILVTIVGVNIGDVGIVPESLEGANLTENASKVSSYSDICDPKFLLCQLSTPYNKFKFQQIAAGAAQGKLGLFKIKGFKVTLPKIDIQKKIVDIYFNYTFLIENNRRRIQLLEEAARLLFREWFVYFRFPGHEKVKIVDGVPDGWNKVLLSKLIDFKEGPGLRNHQFRGEGIPFLNIRTFGNDEIDLSKVGYLDETEVYEKYKHFLLQEDDHVISSSGTLGRLVTIRTSHLPLMLNTSLIRMRPKQPMRKWTLKAYLLYGGFVEKASSFAIGAAQLNFGPLHLNKMTILFPNNIRIIDEFEKIISTIYLIKKNLLDQNQKLAQARDLLLPRLMSGAIEV